MTFRGAWEVLEKAAGIPGHDLRRSAVRKMIRRRSAAKDSATNLRSRAAQSAAAFALLLRCLPGSRESMVNVTIIFGLLVIPYLIAYLFHFHNLTLAGRIGVCFVFLLAALGHFLKTDAMISMLPRFVPARRAVIYISGVFEILLAIGVVSLPNPAYLGWMIVAYLIAIFPSNIYATIERVPFGGHSMGPRYLFARFPLQLLLVLWTYWFCVKGR